jgi:hypothetical protein
MYIYNVTVKVTPKIEADWVAWMQTIHLQEVVNTGMFQSFSFSQLIEPTDDEGATYVAQYYTDSLDKYNQYIEQFAPSLREKGYAKFGNEFIGFRSLLKNM